MSNISDDTKHRALQLCQEFMGRSWNSLHYDDFAISQVSGGLSNLLYLCEIASEKIQTEDDEPRKVLLRLYGSIILENPEMVVTDSVIFGLLAEKGFGPKLFGVFTGGRVEQYLESRHLRTSELHIPDVSRECARVMSKFHRMTMPLVKKPLWLIDLMDRYLRNAEDLMQAINKSEGNTKFLPELVQKIESYNITRELKTLKNILAQVESPVTFCHNDMQEGNLLLRQGESLRSCKGHILPIDYEHASFNFRGFDIGNHFCEWCFNYHEVEEFPKFSTKLEDYPNKEEQLNFINVYIEEMGLQDDKLGLNSPEHIRMEANVYALASHYLWALWGVVQADISTIDFGYLEYAVARFEAYFTQKRQLIAEYGLKE